MKGLKTILAEVANTKDPVKTMAAFSKKLGVGKYDGRTGIILTMTELKRAQQKLEEMDYELKSSGKDSMVWVKKGSPDLLINVNHNSDKALLGFY